MVANKNLVRVQEKGQITLPRSIRDELGIKKGDIVSVELNGRALSVVPQTVIPETLARKIEEEIAEYGISWDEMDAMIEQTRDRRPALVKEMYGIDLEG